MVARCVVALATVPDFGPPFVVFLVESFPPLPLCLEPDAAPFYKKRNIKDTQVRINKMEKYE